MMMERFILVAVCVVTIASVLYIPKDKIRISLLAFIAFQATTWAYTIFLVQKKSLEFPVREFINSTRINFIPQFLLYPAVFLWFILLYPGNSSLIKKAVHYLLFVSIPIWFIYFISVYTDLEKFTKGTANSQVIRMYISFSLQFLLCRLYVAWFSKKTGIS